MNLELALVDERALGYLLPFMERYHAFEELIISDAARREAVSPLLGESNLGRVWLVTHEGNYIGYIAICFCYSIEFGGRVAFIDEFYLDETSRGKGIGSKVLLLVLEEIRKFSVRALHLEVAKTNEKAIALYMRIGFRPRDRYDLYAYEVDPEPQGARATFVA